jgi:hypothetical protein
MKYPLNLKNTKIYTSFFMIIIEGLKKIPHMFKVCEIGY